MSQQVTVRPALQSYQVATRPEIDIRSPAPGLVEALAGQFEYAVYLAEGRMCVSVPYSVDGDGTRSAVETVLHAAAARREATTGTAVRVQVTDARYTDDGYCHVLASCESRPATATAGAPAVGG